MSLESNSWINTDHKLADAKENFDSFKASRGLLKIPSKQFTLPPDGRLLEGGVLYKEQYIEAEKTSAMFNPSDHHHQGMGDPQHLQPPPPPHSQDTGEKATMAEFPFCYNTSSMMQKGPPAPSTNGLDCVNTACNTDKSQAYRFDMSPSFGYNYALVNQMSLAAAASSATFKCEVCGLVFAHISLLNHHKRIHINEPTPPEMVAMFTCDVCGAIFSQQAELRVHRDSAHAPPPKVNKPMPTTTTCEDSKKKPNKFSKCKSCVPKAYESVAVGNSGSVDVAVGTDELIISDTGPTSPPKEFHPVKRRKVAATVAKCEKCNGTGIIIVGNVEPDVEKPFHCNICDSSFARYSSLWSHRRLHSGDKPYKCELCGVTFARAAYLKNHGKVHTGERPFKCSTCGMAFSQSAHLKNHERIHSGERPYECDYCGKNFARHSTLWNHRRIHTGEKPYECDICGTCFNQASHLRNHTKVHTGEKPHKCDICDVGFSDKFALKRHRGIHEKYGQTAPGQAARHTSTNSNSSQEWKPLNQPQSSQNQAQQLQSPQQMQQQQLQPQQMQQPQQAPQIQQTQPPSQQSQQLQQQQSQMQQPQQIPQAQPQPMQQPGPQLQAQQQQMPMQQPQQMPQQTQQMSQQPPPMSQQPQQMSQQSQQMSQQSQQMSQQSQQMTQQSQQISQQPPPMQQQAQQLQQPPPQQQIQQAQQIQQQSQQMQTQPQQIQQQAQQIQQQTQHMQQQAQQIQQQQAQQMDSSAIYKTLVPSVPTTVAFPGCSRPVEK